jgi:hypothetical protein
MKGAVAGFNHRDQLELSGAGAGAGGGTGTVST